MQWVSASMPVAAVSQAGRPRVSSGSQIARLGIRCGLMKPSLRPSASVISAARPTSLPVPAVVGIAITGAVAGGDLRRRRRGSRHSRASGPGWVGEQRDALGEVDRRAAAEGDDAVAALGAVERRAPPRPPPRSGWSACHRRLRPIGQAPATRSRSRPPARRHRSPAAGALRRGRPGRASSPRTP